MATISPEQQVFTRLRRLCIEEFGESKVFDYQPPEGTSYPFIHVGEQFSQNVREHKDGLGKHTQVVVHVWHNNWRQRGTVTGMMHLIERAIIKEYGVDGESINSRVIEDNSTGVTLLHGIVDTNIKI